jgi:hypothetical protein
VKNAERIVAAVQYAKIGMWGLASMCSAVGSVLQQVEGEVRKMHDLAPPEPDPAIRSAAEVVAQHMRATGEQTINDYGPNLNDLNE